MQKESLPALIETGVSVSIGGKVQVKRYEIDSTYHFSVNGKWSIPEDWDENDSADFRAAKIEDFKKELEAFVEHELDSLFEQRRKINSGEHTLS
jgi:hypothetical protein